MAQTNFTLNLTLDGSDVKQQAAQLKAAIQGELAGGFEIKVDAKGAKAATTMFEAVAKNAPQLEQASAALVALGKIDAAGLAAADKAMSAILKTAGKVGAELAAGAQGGFDKLQSTLAAVQAQLSGVIKSSGKGAAAGLLDDMPELTEAINSQDKKAFELAEKLRAARIEADAAKTKIAELGQVKVAPVGGGAASTLAELFRGFDSEYVSGKIRKAVKAIDAELAPIQAQIDARMGGAVDALAAERARLEAEIARVGAEFDRLNTMRPGAGVPLFDEGDVVVGDILPPGEWDAAYAQITAEYDALNKQLDQVRSEAIRGDAAELRDELYYRRRELEKPLEGEFRFWEEWATGNIDAVVQMLKASGQTAQAEALSQMAALTDTYKRAQSAGKRAFGGMQETGGTVALPKDATGTLVDFVTAEKALGAAAEATNTPIQTQARLLGNLTKKLQAAAAEAARMAAVEVGVTAAADTPVAEIAAQVDAAVAQTTAELASPEPVQAAEKQASGILAAFVRLYDRLVGHSIIPDMVNEINAWLARIDPAFFGEQALVDAAEKTAAEVVDEFAAIAEFVPVEAVGNRLAELQAEIEGFNQEMAATMLRGGSTPEVEARLAEGYLPQGFGLSGETQYDKALAERQKREMDEVGAVGETTDQWYRALAVGLEVKQRFTQAETQRMEEVMAGLATAEAQFAGLVASLYQQIESLSQAVAESENPEAEFTRLGEVETLLGQVAAAYGDVSEAKDAAVLKAGEVEGIAGVQEAQAEVAEQAAARAEARTPAGIAAIEAERRQTAAAVGLARERVAAARAEAEAKIAAARSSAAVVVETEKQATAAIKAEGLVQVETAKQATAAAQAKAKAAAAQKTEAARRVTVKAKTAGAVAVVDAKAQNAELLKQNTLLREAQKLAGEIGMPWAQVQATMQETGASLATVVGEMKGFKAESQAAAKAQAGAAAQTERLRAESIALGIPWGDVEDAMQRTGLSTKAMQGVLARVKRETMLARAETGVWGRVFSEATTQAQGMAKAISDARNEYQGITQLAGDVQTAGRSMQQVGTGITGALTLAGKEYIDFTATADVAARALGLDAAQAENFSQVVIDLAGDLAYVSADELAQGVITWAKAVGQTAETEDDFRRIIEQTIPAQQAAALSQENLNILLEGGAAALRQFNLPMSELGRVLALEGKVADGTNASFESLNEALKYLGPTAQALGVPLEDVLATLGLLEEAGISGSQAGTGIGKALRDIAAPTKKATETLEEYFGAAQPFFEGGKFVGIPKMIEKWAAALKGKNDEEQQAALAAVYDANAVRALQPLIQGQIDAWDSGINVARAYSKNLQGITDAEVEAWAARKLSEEGIAVEMGGAEEVRQRQLEQYMASQKRQVDELKAAWAEFWLVVGGQATGAVIGSLQNIADIVEKITAIADAHPELTKLAGGVGLGLVAGGTLLNGIGALARSWIAIKSLHDGFKAWLISRTGAETAFQTKVVSAAESFRAIITQAATAAAGTEQAGATAETTTENAGAVAENAIEAQGAVAENAIEASGALKAAGVLGLGLAAAYGVMKAGEAITGRKFGETVTQTASLMSYGMGSLIGKGPEFLNFTYGLGEALGLVQDEASGATDGLHKNADGFAALGAAMDEADSTTYSNPAPAAGLLGMGIMLPTIMKDLKPAADVAGGGLDNLKDNLEDLGPTADETAEDLEKQIKAAELYADLLKERAALERQLTDTLAGLSRDLNNDLARLAQDYEKNRVKAEADFQASQVQALRDFNAEREKAQAEHNKAMRRLDEDHAVRVADLGIERDALGLYEEQRAYELEKARAEEDFADQQAEGAAEFAAEREQAAAEHAVSMADAAAQYAQERAARLTEYQTAVAEAQAQHAEEMARLDQEYFERINAELGYYALSKEQQAAYNQAMLADARSFLAANRAQWAAYVASLPIPGRYTGPSDAARRAGAATGSSAMAEAINLHASGERASGGYVGGGLYNLHPGEFVLSPETTRQVEAAQGGGRLTQGAVAAGARSLKIEANFTGMGAGDRVWFEARLAEFAGQVAAAVAG